MTGHNCFLILHQPLENYLIVNIFFNSDVHRSVYCIDLLNNVRRCPYRLSCLPAPSVSPTNITAFNTSSTSLRVTWQPISTQGLRGIFRAYRVYYIEQETYFTRSLKNVTVDAATLEVELVDLYKFTNYIVYVVARTNKDGMSSEKVNAFTDEDSKFLMFSIQWKLSKLISSIRYINISKHRFHCIIFSEKRTVFRERSSRNTVSFENR